MSNKKFIPHVTNETNQLKKVVLGLAESQGPLPTLDQTYDAKSYEAVQKGFYPTEADMCHEMSSLKEVFDKYGIEVYRPDALQDYNQLFARDVAFVIDDRMFVANIIPDRAKEINAFQPVFDMIEPDHLIQMPEKVYAEGGDVLLYNDILFIGTYTGEDFASYKTARTNQYGIDYFKDMFPNKTIVPIDLKKHDSDPYRSVLHLDCAFQPVGPKQAVFYPDGMRSHRDIGIIEEVFGKDNLFAITPEEAYDMNSNFFSISPEVVIIEERAKRLNQFLTEQVGMTVETVPYAEISKQGGLLRCSTCPLVRE